MDWTLVSAQLVSWLPWSWLLPEDGSSCHLKKAMSFQIHHLNRLEHFDEDCSSTHW